MLKWRLPKPVFWSNIDFFGGKISLWAIVAGGGGLLFKSNLFRDKAIIGGRGYYYGEGDIISDFTAF